MRPATLLAALLPCLPLALLAQEQSTAAPAPALDLVVALRATFEGGDEEFGAGVMVAITADSIYLATARHVVVKRNQRPTTLLAQLRDSTEVAATVRNVAGPSLDLAVVVLPRPATMRRPALDRLGQPRVLRFGSPVRAIGCPAAVCWSVAPRPDAVMELEGTEIGFQSETVRPGSSGGALFNSSWEVVGIVIQDEPPRANAISMDEVLASLAIWNVPSGLHPPAIPRAGYRQTIQASLFGVRDRPFATLPAGRVGYTRRTEGRLFWQATLLRLVDDDRAIDGAMLGAGSLFRTGRLALRPFVELGLLRVQGRFDGGGYYVDAGNGSQRYVPVWNHVTSSGIGGGAGVVIEYILRPPLIVEVMAGRWGYTPPEGLSGGSSTAFGAGLRLGRR